MRKVAGKCAKLRHFDIKNAYKTLTDSAPLFSNTPPRECKGGRKYRREKFPNRFDNGSIPTASHAYDSITVTRNSSLISCARRKLLSGYSIDRGSFYWRGDSRDLQPRRVPSI
jgi:hypothetical protein